MVQNKFNWQLINDSITVDDKETLIDFIKNSNLKPILSSVANGSVTTLPPSGGGLSKIIIFPLS